MKNILEDAINLAEKEGISSENILGKLHRALEKQLQIELDWDWSFWWDGVEKVNEIIWVDQRSCPDFRMRVAKSVLELKL